MYWSRVKRQSSICMYMILRSWNWKRLPLWPLWARRARLLWLLWFELWLWLLGMWNTCDWSELYSPLLNPLVKVSSSSWMSMDPKLSTKSSESETKSCLTFSNSWIILLPSPKLSDFILSRITEWSSIQAELYLTMFGWSRRARDLTSLKILVNRVDETPEKFIFFIA